jgi:prepilin-type N-terminal cleavage/methylation domain-containing protein
MSISHKHHAGFTLLEVLVALALFSLLSGALMLTVRNCLSGAAGLQQMQEREQTMAGFTELCSHTFRTLPATASLEGGIFQVDGKFIPQVILRQAPQAFSWGDDSQFQGESILSARAQTGGLFSLGLARVPTKNDTFGSEPEVRWLLLIKDIKEIKWRFYDPRQTRWLDEWRDGSTRPSLIELNLLMPGEKIPLRRVFWLPALVRSQP